MFFIRKKKKNKIYIFFLVGLSLALIAEIWRFIFIAEDKAPDTLGWFFMVVSYILILSFAYRVRNKIKSNFLYYLFFASLGVLLEFLLLGTNPFTHWIVFLWVASFWGSITLFPKLYISKKLKKQTISFTVTSFILFFLTYLTTKESATLAFFFISLNIPLILWQKD